MRVGQRSTGGATGGADDEGRAELTTTDELGSTAALLDGVEKTARVELLTGVLAGVAIDDVDVACAALLETRELELTTSGAELETVATEDVTLLEIRAEGVTLLDAWTEDVGADEAGADEAGAEEAGAEDTADEKGSAELTTDEDTIAPELET